MPVDITMPSPGESINEVVIGPWHKSAGEWVQKDEIIVEIESDKVTLEVTAPESGLLQIAATEGAEMTVGDVIGSIDPDADHVPRDQRRWREPARPAAETDAEHDRRDAPDGDQKATPVARKLAAEKGVDLSRIKGTGPSGRVTKADVLAVAESADHLPPKADAVAQADSVSAAAPHDPHVPHAPPTPPTPTKGARSVRRERMSKLRQRIAERLVAAQRTAAMLTTFNEADMSAVMNLRKRYKEQFLDTHGVGLGFMSFFIKSCVAALSQFPRVNAFIEGDEIEYHDFVDMSIAVGTPRGLVVPVIRNAEAMSFAEVEKAIVYLATRAREGKLTLDEMSGGTFTISNGGVYGSMMSTPILNPPQSGILGLHRITNRPVEDPHVPGQIVLRPMMYLALSYDHRIIDGEQAVKFLVHVRTSIEDPQRMMLDL